jgi:hypothetical protein
MKLRIKGDSLRLRLTQGEVATLGETGAVEDQVRFGAGAALIYRLKRDAAASDMRATFANGTVEVRLPERMATAWCGSDEVTLSGKQSAAAGAELRIVVEKDWRCLTAREGEDESDHFENPNQTC